MVYRSSDVNMLERACIVKGDTEIAFCLVKAEASNYIENFRSIIQAIELWEGALTQIQ